MFLLLQLSVHSLLLPFHRLWLLFTPCCPRRKDLSLNFPYHAHTLPLFFCAFCYVPRFLERGFPCLLREFGWVWVRNCCCCGPAKLFETLYMILVCTNKLDLTCLQLHHSYEACLCLNQSGSLCSLSPSARLVMFPWFAIICSPFCLLKRSPGIYHEVLIAM